MEARTYTIPLRPAWVLSRGQKGTEQIQSNIVFTTLSVHLDCQVATTEHVPGKMNIIMDGLSRDVDPSSLGLDPTLQYDAAQDKSIIQFLKLCDPDTSLADIHDHTALMNECNALLRP